MFLTLLHGEVVGFGLIERSSLFKNVASLGIYTFEPYRELGAGTANRTYAARVPAHRRTTCRGLPYYNHASKRTLERAGMYASSRLLHVTY